MYTEFRSICLKKKYLKILHHSTVMSKLVKIFLITAKEKQIFSGVIYDPPLVCARISVACVNMCIY